MSDQQLIPTPGTFGENGNFLLERELGAGGMGGVYMGRDKMLDRPVAVKVMLKEYGEDQEFVEKFKKEAQAAARLIHPNIAQIYSYGICEGMPYIAMELASGGSLYSIMNANPGKTDVTRVLKICQQTAQALQCAADQGCVHGDVKPENVLLDASGNAKLVDFGLAAMQKDTDEIWGTPYYISPEKVRKEPIDFRADIYSLGGTLYHALTGVAPFEGEDSIAVVKKRFDGAPKKPSEIRSDLSPAIDELVLKMLELDPENRYPSWEAVLEAMKSVLTSGLTAKLATGAVEGSTASAGTRTVMRGGRRVVMRRKTTVSKAAAVTPETAADESDAAEKKADGDDEEEGGGNLAAKAIGVVVGVIVLIALVIGGLVWYQIADKKARAAEEQSQISGGIAKARSAIADTVANAVKFADEFDEFARRAVEECEKPTQQLKRLLSEDVWKMLKPATSKELEAAIAATNEVQAAAAPAAAPAATNETAKAAAAPAAKDAKAPAAKDAKAPAAKDAKVPAKDAKVPAKGEKPAAEVKAKQEPKAEPPPQIVITMNELWERAYGCLASAVRIRHAVRQIVKKGAEADAYSAADRASMEKLAELSRVLVDMLDQVKASKDVENVRKGITFIKSKGESTVASTEKRLRIEKLEAERKAKAEAAAAAEKARKEKLEAERQAKIDAETGAIKEKFDLVVAQGNLRQLDWKGALRQLENVKSEFKTAEGQLAAGIQIRKVNDMKKVHDIFIRSLPGHVFKGKMRGAKVVSVNEKELNLLKADGKSKVRVSWQKFYRDFPGNLNEIINQYVVHGRQNARPRLNLRDWADAMTGAALTMQLVCAEVNGAIERSEALAKETVKEFPEYLKVAQEIFPDIKFEESEE